MNKINSTSLTDEVSIFLGETDLEKSAKEKIVKYTHNQEENAKGLIQSVVSVVLTFVGATIIGLSTLFFIAISGSKHIEISVLITSIILYFIPGFYFKKENNHLLGNTLICIASMTASFSIFENTSLFVIWLGMNIIGLVYSNSRFLTVFLLGILNIMTAFFLHFSSIRMTGIHAVQALTIINLLLLVASYKFKAKLPLLKQFFLINKVTLMSLIGFFCFLFSLTFFKTIGVYEYFIYNIIYFVLSTGFLIWSFKHDVALYRGLAILSWFSFLFYKYYDLLWKLLHKSVSLFLFGFLFICIGIILHKRAAYYVK